MPTTKIVGLFIVCLSRNRLVKILLWDTLLRSYNVNDFSPLSPRKLSILKYLLRRSISCFSRKTELVIYAPLWLSALSQVMRFFSVFYSLLLVVDMISRLEMLVNSSTMVTASYCGNLTVSEVIIYVYSISTPATPSSVNWFNGTLKSPLRFTRFSSGTVYLLLLYPIHFFGWIFLYAWIFIAILARNVSYGRYFDIQNCNSHANSTANRAIYSRQQLYGLKCKSPLSFALFQYLLSLGLLKTRRCRGGKPVVRSSRCYNINLSSATPIMQPQSKHPALVAVRENLAPVNRCLPPSPSSTPLHFCLFNARSINNKTLQIKDFVVDERVDLLGGDH